MRKINPETTSDCNKKGRQFKRAFSRQEERTHLDSPFSNSERISSDTESLVPQNDLIYNQLVLIFFCFGEFVCGSTMMPLCSLYNHFSDSWRRSWGLYRSLYVTYYPTHSLTDTGWSPVDHFIGNLLIY